MLGVRVRLLQMAWTSGQTPSMSASTTALLELAAAMLSRLSASGRSAFTASTTSNLRTATANQRAPAGAGSATDSLCSASTAAATTSAGLLVLHQRTSRLYNAGRMSRERGPMLPHQRSGGEALWFHPNTTTTAAAADLYNGSATGKTDTNVYAGDSAKATLADTDTDCAADFDSAHG